MFDVRIIGQRIKELRLQRGLTQSKFAEELYVSFQAVSSWERGVTPPDLENLVRIAAYFGVLVDDLIHPKGAELFLGIDGGGTKTKFAVVTADGYVLKHITRDGCNPNDIGLQKTVSILTDGIGSLLSEYPTVKSVFCGIAGITTGDHRKRLYAELTKHYPKLKIDIKSDAFSLFAMAEGTDMSVISGTGSVVFVRRDDGQVRLGGWGYLFDRAGSAYDMGRDAIRIALEEEDMGRESSLLGELIREKIGGGSVWEHLNSLYSGGKPYIASFAATVFEAYRAGDAGAIRIVDDNAKALAELLNKGVELYGVRPTAVASGGIFEHYEDIMLEHIAKYSNVKLMIGDLPPIYGACRNACLMELERLSETFGDNFKKTYGGTEA